MSNHDFFLAGCDTDSVMITKNNGKPFSSEEQQSLLDEINSLFPQHIKFAHDGYYKSVVYVKAKNYILWDGKKIKYKGSAIKASTKEKALKEFIDKVIDLLLNKNKDQLFCLYNEYVKEIKNLTDITRWTSKKTITKSVLHPERTNEQKVLDALKGVDYQEGDKFYFYFDVNDKLKLQEHFDYDYNVDTLLKKLYNTLEIFSTVIDTDLFPNYTLKKNKSLLERI